MSRGSQARYTYHFDHNALTDGVLAGQSLFALTDSGNLHEFNAETLELNGQVIVPGRALFIAAESKDSALIGTFDGHILRVRAKSLQMETATFTPGNVVWLSAEPSTSSLPERIVFVIDRSPDLRP